MLISLNEIKRLVPIKLNDSELIKLIGSRLVEVESVSDWSKKYKNIFIVKVLSAEPIEGTHLSLCKINAGPSRESVQVVCGAPNVKKGMFSVWIAPGAVVPSTFGTAEPFEIGTRKMRGFESNGMLAGADELGLGDDHSGIVELAPDTFAPGTLFADAFDLNDLILEVENKSLTHRPDCFGLIGFAREVAGILGQPFAEPAPFNNFFPEPPAPSDAVSISVENPELCPRYSCAVFDFDSKKAHSPFLEPTDIFLFKAGMRPISPIVDLTNRLMLLTGQPLHAFDYDKFLLVGNSDQPKISVRLARENETLTLLDGETLSLAPHDILICSNDAPVALAGAMGGESTKIDASTKKIILESATFSLYNLRKTQMSHGLFSEAITRFTKGQPAALTLPVLLEAARLLNQNPSFVADFFPGKSSPSPISVSVDEINSLLGTSYPEPLIRKTLENVGFFASAEKDSDRLDVLAPAWRTDIKIKEDIAEEIGRLLGFDNIPLSFPTRPFLAASVDPMLRLKSTLRNILSDRLGLNEVLTYSFVSDNLLKKANLSPDSAYKLVNSLSPELERFRPSLLPSLFDKVRLNEKAGFKDFMLYEINQITSKPSGLSPENVPNMTTSLAITGAADFFRLKALFFEVEKSLNLHLTLAPVESHPFLEPTRSAEIFLGKTSVGFLGELKLSVRHAFKLSETHSALELALDPCLSTFNRPAEKKKFIKLSRFPSVSRDLTFRVSSSTPFSAVESNLASALSEVKDLSFTLVPISIFSRPDSSTKNLSFHLELSNPEKTFDSTEVSAIIEKITNRLTALGAEVV